MRTDRGGFSSSQFCHWGGGEIRDCFIKSFSCYPAVARTIHHSVKVHKADTLYHQRAKNGGEIAFDARFANSTRVCVSTLLIDQGETRGADNKRSILPGSLVGDIDICEWISSRNRRTSARIEAWHCYTRAQFSLAPHDETQWRVRSGSR